MSIVFGPVPSRRLGRSLGINHIPPKTCTYSCVYCQVGRTTHMQIEPPRFYGPEEIVAVVQEKLAALRDRGESIDYFSFVPDGEPTLDADLGDEIAMLRPLGVPIAVITNSSLLWRPEVREALALADWVSVKVDAVREETWHAVDRPHGRLSLSHVLEGIERFASSYGGQLMSETMLIQGVNDSAEDVDAVAEFLDRIQPDCAYLSIPTRPPAETWAHGPDEMALSRAYQLLSTRLPRVEYLIGYEGDRFAATGDVPRDLLSITAVHPMRERAVRALLARTGADWSIVDSLVSQGDLVTTAYEGITYYVRPVGSRAQPSPDAPSIEGGDP